MRLIKSMTRNDLLMCSVDLVSKTYIGIGQPNVEEDTISYFSQELADDLANVYKNFYFEDAENAFKEGIRESINSDFIHFTIPIYMKWLRKHKELIWDARSKVDRGDDPKQVPYYRPEPKLLK